MKKKLLFGIICLVSLGLLTGCSLTKKAITTKDFTTIAEDQGFIITDVLEQFEGKDHVKQATVAASTEGWQVEFYEISTEEKAKEMYDKNKEDFESISKVRKTSVDLDGKNYSKFTAETEDYYLVLTRVEKTVFYAKVPVGQKDDVSKLVKALKY